MKKWSKLVLATMLSAGTLLVSGCIENLEPEGIADLREAKLELLNAQIALQRAQAAKVEADAALVLAEVKIKEAIAKQEEAKVKFVEAQARDAEYAAEYQKLLNERESLLNAALEAENAAAAEAARIENERALAELERYMAETQQKMEEAEREAQIAAAELAAELKELQARLVEAEQAYEIAVKELAAAKVMLSPLQQAYVAFAQAEVMNWELEVENLTSQLEFAAESLESAIADFEENTELAVKAAEDGLAIAEANLDAAVEAAKLAEKALEIDTEVVDWAAQREALREQLDEMKLERDLARVEREKEIETLMQQNDEINKKIEIYEDATGYSLNGFGFSLLPVNTYRTRFYVPETYVAAPVDEDGNKPFGDDFYIAPDDVYFKYDDMEYALDLFDSRIEGLSYLNEDYFDAQIESEKEIISLIEENFESDITEHADAVAAYHGDVYDYFRKYVDPDCDIEARVNEFNAALKSATTAIDTFNDECGKRLPKDNSEAVDAVRKEYQDAVAAAYAVLTKTRQTELDKRNAEETRYNKAVLVYDRAFRIYDTELTAVFNETGYWTVADLKQAVDSYESQKAAAEAAGDDTFDQDGAMYAEYQRNLAGLRRIEAAQKVYDDPLNDKDDVVAVWSAAQKAWTDAVDAYDKAVNAAQNAYDKTSADAMQKRDYALEDLNVDVTGMDSQYLDYLLTEVEDAMDEMNYALNALQWLSVIDYEYVNNVILGDENLYYVNLSIPSFAYDEESGSIRSLKAEDLVDKEYFLETIVTAIAEGLVNFEVYASGYAMDEYGNETYHGDYYYYVYESESMPLVLPDNDEYAAFVAEALEDSKETVAAELYGMGYGNIQWCDAYVSYSSAYTQKFDAENTIEALEATKTKLALIPDFVAALKAAKAEFEEYAAGVVAEIDALREEIEAELPELIELLDALQNEEIAYNTEVAEITKVVNTLSALIEEYIGTKDVEALVAGLESAHEAALKAVEDAESALEDAEADLEKAKAGDTSAVELAQKNYDKIAAKLADAISELEAAAAALEAAIAEVTPVAEEETPAV